MASTLAWSVFVFLTASAYLAEAQVPFFGPCPDLQTMVHFDINKYLGRWYEAERYFAVFQFAGKCVTANYTDAGDGIVNVVNFQISSLTGIPSSIEGQISADTKQGASKLYVKFPGLPVPMDAPYWVLDTDYDSYSVVWSCTDFGIFSARNAWILTRSPEPPLDVMERAYAVVDRNGVSRAYFIRTDQRNCPSDLNVARSKTKQSV